MLRGFPVLVTNLMHELLVSLLVTAMSREIPLLYGTENPSFSPDRTNSLG